MIFIERRNGIDRRKIVTGNLEPEKEKRKNSVGRRITDRLEKIKIEPNDFILFKIHNMTEAIKASASDITQHVRKKGGFVVFTLPTVAVEKLSEKQMNKLGWYRKNDNT